MHSLIHTVMVRDIGKFCTVVDVSETRVHVEDIASIVIVLTASVREIL